MHAQVFRTIVLINKKYNKANGGKEARLDRVRNEIDGLGRKYSNR